MLEELKFVQGAVAKKTMLPTLNHFRIENGEVRSYNGVIALSSPIELDINCVPKADPFIKAIQNCKETVSLKMTETGRLAIKSGPFKAFIECIEEETCHVTPEGEIFDINGEQLIKAFTTIAPFIGDDASRPWCNGVLLKGQSAYATNNVSLVEYWVGSNFPVICNIPKVAIKEMIRIKEPPIKAQVEKNSISFHYENGKWIRATLLDIKWPDLEKVFESETNPQPIKENLFEALEAIKPFTDKIGRVYILDGTVNSGLTKEEGASYNLEGAGFEGVYQIHILELLRGVVQSIDFSTYPKPCQFFGDRLRGAIIGLKT